MTDERTGRPPGYCPGRDFGGIDIDHPEKVTISRDRWNVWIEMKTNGSMISLVASADSFMTENDGIWFSPVYDYMAWEG